MEKTNLHKRVKADLEKDLFNLLLKFRKQLKEEAESKMSKNVKGTALQRKLAALNKISAPKKTKKESKTEQEIKRDQQIKEMNESLLTENMCERFTENMRQIENGEFKVDLFKSKSIERMIKDEGLLSKCEPINFRASL